MGALGRRWTPVAAVLALGLGATCVHLGVVSSSQSLLSVAYSDGPAPYDDGHSRNRDVDDGEDEDDDDDQRPPAPNRREDPTGGHGPDGGDEDDGLDDHGPYVDLWRRRFASKSGSVFFKHIRKAAGSMIKQFLFRVFEYHGHGTFEQFLKNNDRKEVERHYKFFSERQIEKAEIYFNGTKGEERAENINKVYYVEQEFTTMDWQCQDVDPRWNDSISIIVMRHPIERHLSEFFYSGPPATEAFDGVQFGNGDGGRRGYNRLKIDRDKLYVNKTYTHMLSTFIQQHLPRWAVREEAGKYNDFRWYFSPRYIDNSQLRSLSGCSSGACPGVDPPHLRKIAKEHPRFNNATAPTIDSTCTHHPFYTGKGRHKAALRRRKLGPPCGPCHHRAAAWGPVDAVRLSRAARALGGFDVVLVAEALDDPDQRALLADAMGVPRDYAARELKRENVNVAKATRRERTHYYRDLMANLTHPSLVEALVEENALEIELYEHAVRLNRRMTGRWKREVQWSDDNEDGGDTDASVKIKMEKS